ncbi:ATP-dependent DNA helicase PIF1 [Linum perenne]
MLDEHNNLVKAFRYARNRLNAGDVTTVKLRLLAARTTDGREYDLPAFDELAALIVDETGDNYHQPDIIVDHQSDGLQRVHFGHPSIMALQYPLLFPYGEDGWHGNIFQQGNLESAKTVSQCDFYAYRIQTRMQESTHLLLSGKLFQQYVVNAYAFVEAERLDWIRNNQTKLRAHYRNGLVDAYVILASSVTGSPRHKYENFQDAMAICRSVGYPDLFVTFTFQKRGLPHAHMLLFLAPEDKLYGTSQIDSVISAEIPDPLIDPLCYEAVQKFMLHGPCGPMCLQTPPTTTGKCKKHFPKPFSAETTIDEDGYPRYRRRETDRWIMKNNVKLDNRFVVPYNRYLLLRFDAHINVEFCNKSRAIKYLFKYINKPPDRDSSIDRLLDSELAQTSMLLEWMRTNGNSPHARQYTFVEFPQHYVWISTAKQWRLRKRGTSIARLYYCHPSSNERFYLRMLLHVVKGCTSFDDIKTVNGVVYESFKDACRAYGFLSDDGEWNQCLQEVANTASARQMRTLFATIIMHCEVSSIESLSGIAALLMTGGRTAHSRFHIPIDCDSTSTCHIQHQSPVADLIRNTSLIIWDEAPMAHKHCIEALDRTLRDVLNCDELPFGGLTMVFGGDFRQILPVIPKSTRTETVNSSLKRSYLWPHFIVIQLHQNMRLKQAGCSQVELAEIESFSNWLLDIGEGKNSSIWGDSEIEIPYDLRVQREDDPVADIVKSTYPNILQHFSDPIYLATHAVLAPLHDTVSLINDYMLKLFPGEEECYYSSDSIQFEAANQAEIEAEYPPEFLNSLRIGNFPDHELKLKVGVPVILLRNIDQSMGLCNGTRAIVRTLGTWSIEVEIITGTNIGDRVYLPRLTLSNKQKSLNFTLLRRQYPLALSFAMTINKSQGQTLQNVGLCLKKQVFTHGQLYVALSRVTAKAGLKIISCDDANNEKSCMKNVVFQEIFD